MKTVAYPKMFDRVYGACILDAFIKYRIDRYTLINTCGI